MNYVTELKKKNKAAFNLLFYLRKEHARVKKNQCIVLSEANTVFQGFFILFVLNYSMCLCFVLVLFVFLSVSFFLSIFICVCVCVCVSCS